MIPDGLARKLVLFALLLGVMTGVLVGLTGLTPGLDQSLGTLGKTVAQQLLLARIGTALPYAAVAAIGIITLFAAAGSVTIRVVATSVSIGNLVAVGTAIKILLGYNA